MSKLKVTALAILALVASFSTFASDTTKVDLEGKRPANRITFQPVDLSRVMQLRGQVTMGSIAPLLLHVDTLALSPKEPAYLLIDSPGGEVDPGLAFIKAMKSLKAHTGLKVTCIIQGKADSMAAIIASYCHETYMDNLSVLMYHQVSFGIGGRASDIKTRVDFNLKWIAVVEADLAAQLGMTYEDYKLLSKDELWLTSEEAVRHGFVDGIAENFYVPQPQKNPLEQLLDFMGFPVLRAGK